MNRTSSVDLSISSLVVSLHAFLAYNSVRDNPYMLVYARYNGNEPTSDMHTPPNRNIPLTVPADADDADNKDLSSA